MHYPNTQTRWISQQTNDVSQVMHTNANGYAHECRDIDSHPDEHNDANEHSDCDQYGDINTYPDKYGDANGYGNADRHGDTNIHTHEHRNAVQHANGRSLSIHYGL